MIEHSGKITHYHNPIVISIEMFPLSHYCLLFYQVAVCRRQHRTAVVSGTSMMPISHSFTSGSDWIQMWWRWRPFNSHSFTLTFTFTEKSLSRSSNQLETSQALWHCIVTLFHPKWLRYGGHEGMDKWWRLLWWEELRETRTQVRRQKVIILNTWEGRKGKWIMNIWHN